ncbi:response regulator [Nevskia soli]|uniref:response regulator n=1 Tax=Nevskia soli TaxID=418856 RepID=UPI0015D68763|nr:response regulator [Nevskia soli]
MIASILIVDDEPAIRELCAAILTQCGYRCEMAGSGAEGLERFASAQGEFDLILSDVVMPDISGPEMVRRMEIIRPDIRSVYMSGFPDASFPPSKKRSPVIKKPFTTDQLTTTIRQTLVR